MKTIYDCVDNIVKTRSNIKTFNVICQVQVNLFLNKKLKLE